MMRNFHIKNRIYIIFIMIVVLFASCLSTYYITTKGEINNNYRVKRIEESQSQTSDFYTNANSIGPSMLSQDSITIQTFDELAHIIHSHKIITFFLIAAILSFIQLYLQIKRRNILVSQTENKIFIVHYLQLKDGKKSSLSTNS